MLGLRHCRCKEYKAQEEVEAREAEAAKAVEVMTPTPSHMASVVHRTKLAPAASALY